MPLQNRVTPFGEIVSVPARGTLFGNRGNLHDASGRIRRPMRLKAWIYCLLEFKGRKRALLQPGSYTELFFLDEATALAAGHRPCAECQRARYNEFMSHWSATNPSLLGGQKLRAPAVDAVLQAERFGPGGRKVTFRSRLGELPAGCMVVLDERPGEAWLMDAGGVRAWSPQGYGALTEVSKDTEVAVLTLDSLTRG